MEIFGKCSQAKVWVSLSVLVAVRHCFLAKQTGLRRCGLQSKCIQPTPGQTCGAILGTWLLKPVSCHCLSGCCWAILWYPQPTNTRSKLKHKHVWPSIKLLKFTAQHFKLQEWWFLRHKICCQEQKAPNDTVNRNEVEISVWFFTFIKKNLWSSSRNTPVPQKESGIQFQAQFFKKIKSGSSSEIQSWFKFLLTKTRTAG